MALLKQPITVGTLELPNRLVMPPMATSKATETGALTKAHLDYYAERAEGGHIGLIITEHSYVSPEGKAGRGQVSLDEDADVEGLARLVEVIHRAGSCVMAQINHAGAGAKPEVTGCEVIGPSAVSVRKSAIIPKEMTGQDIARVTDAFAAAAVRVKEAGFDGVEIHSAHGYLLNQFYSPLANRREDGYGPATLESRLRLHTEIIAAVRAAVGDDFPIALRLGAVDDQEGGSTLKDAVGAAQILEAAGVDLLDISGGLNGYMRPGNRDQGYFSDVTEAIRRVVSTPVLLTGGVTEARAAEELLQAGKADLIGVGRAILKDPAWARRAMTELA